jgi:hypothetical protein
MGFWPVVIFLCAAALAIAILCARSMVEPGYCPICLGVNIDHRDGGLAFCNECGCEFLDNKK